METPRVSAPSSGRRECNKISQERYNATEQRSLYSTNGSAAARCYSIGPPPVQQMSVGANGAGTLLSSVAAHWVDEKALRKVVREEFEASLASMQREPYAAASDTRSSWVAPWAPFGEGGQVGAAPKAEDLDVAKCAAKGSQALASQGSKFEDEIFDRNQAEPWRFNTANPEPDHIVAIMRFIPKPVRPAVNYIRSMREPPRSGILADFVEGPHFDSVCTSVIVLHSVITFFQTNYECRKAYSGEAVPGIFKPVYTAFVVFYFLESSLKLAVHRVYFFVGQHKWWNIVDLSLVAIGIYDQVTQFFHPDQHGLNVVFLRTLRLLKMARVFRVFRLIRSMAVLRLILSCITGSMASLFWSIIMMLLIFFMFGLIFVQNSTTYLLETLDIGEYDTLGVEALVEHFGSVERAVLTMYMASTGGDDWSRFYYTIEPVGFWTRAIFLFFVAFSQIALLNILTGIFVENAMKLAEPDRQAVFRAEEKNHAMRVRELEDIVRRMDGNNDGSVDEDEFHSEMAAEGSALRQYLGSVGIHEDDARKFFRILKVAHFGESVEKQSFIDGCLKLRNGSQSMDLQGVQCELRVMHRKLFHMFRHIDAITAALRLNMPERESDRAVGDGSVVV